MARKIVKKNTPTKKKAALLSSPDKMVLARMVANSMRGFGGGGLGDSWFNSQGSPKRNIYDALGYIKNPTIQQYMDRYTRGDIAKRIVNAPVDASWRLEPTVTEHRPEGKADMGLTDLTPFEKEWLGLTKSINVYHYLRRGDRISGIGQFGIVVLGFNDGLELKEPVVKKANMELMYMMPYSQANVKIGSWILETTDPRYGKPLLYEVTPIKGDGKKASTLSIHYSRVLHLAEDTTENDIYAAPALESVFNRLQDLEVISGGCAEMFWRGAMPGYNFKLDSDVDKDSINKEELEGQISDYVHGMQRFFKTQGMDIQTLGPQVSSPKEQADLQVRMIAATKGIPKRILEGAEAGSLASSQDETSWLSRVDERREQYVDPMILRPFIQKLIDVGVLATPGQDGFIITWPSLFSPGLKDKAEIAVKKADALSKYVSAPGASMIIPPAVFMKDFLDMSDDRIREVENIIDGLEEDDDIPPKPDDGGEVDDA
jgi:hypothetical protein